MSDGVLRELNELFQAKARLGIMTLLLSWGDSDFSTLRECLGLTDGNLGAHLRALEDAGYLEVQKGYSGRRPRTVYRVSNQGRQAFLAYLQQLEAVIRMVNPPRDESPPG